MIVDFIFTKLKLTKPIHSVKAISKRSGGCTAPAERTHDIWLLSHQRCCFQPTSIFPYIWDRGIEKSTGFNAEQFTKCLAFSSQQENTKPWPLLNGALGNYYRGVGCVDAVPVANSRRWGRRLHLWDILNTIWVENVFDLMLWNLLSFNQCLFWV